MRLFYCGAAINKLTDVDIDKPQGGIYFRTYPGLSFVCKGFLRMGQSLSLSDGCYRAAKDEQGLVVFSEV